MAEFIGNAFEENPVLTLGIIFFITFLVSMIIIKIKEFFKKFK